jgi:hypothetical protein
MMKNYLISLALFPILIYSCVSETATEEPVIIPKKVEYSLIETTSWLPGIWENANEFGAMRETWEVVNDSTFTRNCDGYYVSNCQTQKIMAVSILTRLKPSHFEERNGSIFYIPAVKDQNQGLPVKFRLTSSSDSELKFENPDHDFPQVIHYIKVNEDSIFATVSGQFEGQPVEEKFPFKRVK